ncbi:alpha/beta fold hydrolase [Aerococcus tenax]|uniref:alpha/beta hydrolase family protein n=1 Tax=Aerococcus tenax TaxID=3078812 RepID=UPI0018A72CD2|nr:alpha/beta fold hydrolase [Aerococcus tenax]
MTATNYTVRYNVFSDIPVLEVFMEGQGNKLEDFIIGYHGWTNVKESILTQAIAFAKAGFHVVIPDAYLHGQRRPNNYQYQMEKDLASVLKHNVEEFPRLVQAITEAYSVKHMAIFGTSMGGLTTGLIIAKYGQKLDGAVQYIAAIDAVEQLGQLYNQNQASLSVNEDLAFIRSWNLADHLDQLESLPFFVYNGGKDNWINTDINRQLIPKIQSNNEKVNIAYQIYEEEDHWVPFDIIEKSVDFIQKNIY